MQTKKVTIELGSFETARTFQTAYDASMVALAFNREFEGNPFGVGCGGDNYRVTYINNRRRTMFVTDYKFH